MRLSTVFTALVLALLTPPALADDQGIVGTWKLVSMQIDDEPVEDDDVGNRRVVFTKDGTMQAWDGETKDDDGWYELKANSKLVVYTDDDGDGVLDEEEKEEGFELTWSRDGEDLTLSAPIEDGQADSPVMTLKLTLIVD